MAAPGVDDLRVTITAPFCAGMVVMAGATAAAGAAALEPEELPVPPHPHIERLDKRNRLNIAAPVLTWILHWASNDSFALRSSSSKQRELCHVKDRRHPPVGLSASAIIFASSAWLMRAEPSRAARFPLPRPHAPGAPSIPLRWPPGSGPRSPPAL